MSRLWDATLAARLSDVTVVAALGAEIGPAVLAIVRQVGFAIIESTPAELHETALDARRLELLELSSAVGTPLFQSPRRELVEDIKDFSDRDDRDERGYRSAGEMKPHSDPPTLIVLHCVQTARSGGETSLVSVASIVNKMASRNPAWVEQLFQPLPDWRIDGQYGQSGSGPSPIARGVLATHNDELSCVIYRPFIELAADALGAPLTIDQTAALDLFESCSFDPDLTLRFMLQPGQTLVLHNRSVLHARTDYHDWPEFDRRRHLLRTWIDAPTALPVHPSHELGDFFAPLPSSSASVPGTR
jgi:hypothetical protein